MMAKHLVVYICNNGYATKAMDEARKAGARGGTILHGRSSLDASHQTFFGITIHPEKDVLLIITDDLEKDSIIEAINQNYGVTTDARGVLFTLEVDKTVGIDLKQTFKDKKDERI